MYGRDLSEVRKNKRWTNIWGTVQHTGPPGLPVIPGKMKEYSAHKKDFSYSNTTWLSLEYVCTSLQCTKIQATRKEEKSGNLALTTLSHTHKAIPYCNVPYRRVSLTCSGTKACSSREKVCSPQLWEMVESIELWRC